jgi:hypothetical protein
MKKVYIVTLKNRNDLESFYEEMESAGGNSSIPEGEVECVERRPISRNTHYLLTEEEANALRNDSRVWAVEEPLGQGRKKLVSYATQTSDFWKGSETETWQDTAKNWGLYRNFIDSTVAGWGAGNTNVENDSISWSLEGENVDIIINDTLVDPDHPEFAVNDDGTGGSRVQQINWADYDDYVISGPSSWHSQLFDVYENHGSLCAAIAAGNTHGLARKSNIYSINSTDTPKFSKFKATVSGNQLNVTYVYPGSEPIAIGGRIKGPLNTGIYQQTISGFGTGSGGVGTYTMSSAAAWDSPMEKDHFIEYTQNYNLLMWDYIRAFHRFKPTNSVLNKQNPTIVNASYGVVETFSLSEINSVNYRGTTYNSGNTTWSLSSLYANFGVVSIGSTIYVLGDYPALTADIEDAVSEGIVVIHASGNTSNKIDVPGGDDYDNYLSTTSGTSYYHRGGAFSPVPEVIEVGAIGYDTVEKKADYSSAGPRVNVFAPGSGVIGAAAGTNIFGEISSYQVSNNVARFYLLDNRGLYGLYEISFELPVRVNIQMDTSTQFNGLHDIVAVESQPAISNPAYFEINFTTADIALTNESGTFQDAQASGSVSTSLVSDPRDYTKYLWKSEGTSFAAPQITGLVACWLGYYGRIDIDEFTGLLNQYGLFDELTTVSGTTNYNEPTSLLGAANWIAKYYEFRQSSGYQYPQQIHKGRFTGFYKNVDDLQLYPRQRTLRYGA